MKRKVLAFNVYVKASKGAVSFCYVEASAAVRYFKKMTVCCQHFCIRGSREKLSQEKTKLNLQKQLREFPCFKPSALLVK